MYIPRILEASVLHAVRTSRKVSLVLGARQTGKTTLIRHLLTGMGGHVIILNMDIAVDRARLESAAALPPRDALRALGGANIVVVDEAQRWPEIGRIVKGWYDAGMRSKIILLGSSSLNLLDQAAESLTGRNEKFTLTPLLLAEILARQEWYSPAVPADTRGAAWQGALQALLLRLLVYGSYPGVFLANDPEEELLTLAGDYLLKDVFQGDLVRTPETVKELLLLLAHQIGSEVSIAELSNTLDASRITVERYLDLLERTFVIFRIGSFSSNPRKEIRKGRKIYFWDMGVRNALLKEFSLSPHRSDIGPLFENWVAAECMKRNVTQRLHQDMYFWRTREGSEVNLILRKGKQLQPYEVKWSAHRRPRSVRSFTRAYGVPPQLIHHENILEHLCTVV